MTGGRRADDGGLPYFGLYPAIVTDIVDPAGLGRIQVKFPTLGEAGDQVRAWATLLTLYADDSQGFRILPAVDTQVVVAFEAGNSQRAYIVGSCWNGKESLPEAPEAANNKRLIKTRSGSLLEFDDTAGAAKVTLSMSSGLELVLDDGAKEVRLTCAKGCVVTLNAAGELDIQAKNTVDITAPAVNVNALTTTFSGIVKCTTLEASVGVISPSYTPGAGNIW